MRALREITLSALIVTTQQVAARGWAEEPGGYRCNTGGPMSRTRREPLRASVLGTRKDGMHCPRALTVGLDFGGTDPLLFMEQLLGECGFASAEEAAGKLLPDIGPCICRPSDSVKVLEVRSAPPMEVLRGALILGHATHYFFDPARPLLWTRTSLGRRLQLYRGTRFYEA